MNLLNGKGIMIGDCWWCGNRGWLGWVGLWIRMDSREGFVGSVGVKGKGEVR